MVKIAICDEEEYFRIREGNLIAKYMENKGCQCQIDMFRSGKEILSLKESVLQYYVIFLDVSMKEPNGIDVAKEIRKITKEIYLVFVTAYISYALEGYKVEALRYLLKDDECLERAVYECLETILRKMNYEKFKMTFRFQQGKKEIELEDVIYIESNLHKLLFHMAGPGADTYTMYEKLDNVQEMLKGAGFCRIHKSYLVNFRFVEGIRRYKAQLMDGGSLGISKARYSDARNEFVCYRGGIYTRERNELPTGV